MKQYKDSTEAAVDAVKKIGMTCLKSGTVKRLIYTASISSASPLKEDGSGFKEIMDETCYTPLNFSNSYSQQWLRVSLMYLNEPKREIKWGSRKLIEKGFVYKYGMKEILDDCIICARKHRIL
ncbi:hypothetical protein HAX54_030379 [Datura stramonium]|uniref:Uncharacterized protein n=1 Tax=Datura stramonium TaxID=4076 RepID=A0ABS8V7L1_DATST|nr:hypothetical protein [Datura stramonium]